MKPYCAGDRSLIRPHIKFLRRSKTMAIERVKPIELTDNETGKTYTLEFNRDVVRRAEQNGFSIDDCAKFPTKCYDLWYYSFLMHHEREIKRRRADELLDAVGGVTDAPDGLFERLGELYAQAYKTIGDEKNGRVTVTL